jgi:hypothetical protein
VIPVVFFLASVQFSRSAEAASTRRVAALDFWTARRGAGLSKPSSMRRAARRLRETRRPDPVDILGTDRPHDALMAPDRRPAAPFLVLPRKEVIQPQLPLRLPCYDFTPVTGPTFDGSLPKGLGHRLRVLLASVV